MRNNWIEIPTIILMVATVVAGFLTAVDPTLVPPTIRPHLPTCVAAIIAIRQTSYMVLDYMDDGVLNKSYKPPTTLLKVLAIILLPIGLCQCVNNGSTDAELSRAETAVAFAQTGVDLAEVAYVARLADPKTTAIEKAAASLALKTARERLAAESAKLQAIRQQRAKALDGLPSVDGQPSAKPMLFPGLYQAA